LSYRKGTIRLLHDTLEKAISEINDK